MSAERPGLWWVILGICLAAMLQGCSGHAIAKTEVVKLHPFTSSGELVDGYRVAPTTYRVGGIDQTLIDESPFGMVPNTYEVGPTSWHAGACWADPKHPKRVLCPRTPWSRTLRAFVLTQRPATAAPKQPQPYGLLLADGARCQARIGGAAGISSNGWMPAYYCAHETVVTRDEHVVRKHGGQWSVFVGEPVLDKPLKPRRVFVTKAIFLG